MKKWTVKPQNTPAIVRNCSKCNSKKRFICSGNFRVNANGRNIDVWLIYKCEICDSTLNITILSRVDPKKINPELYKGFEKNDFNLAMHYAFDKNILRKNNAIADYSVVEYIVEQKEISSDSNETEIYCEYDFGLRLDKLISDTLGISRTKSKALLEQNGIPVKSKLNYLITIKEIP